MSHLIQTGIRGGQRGGLLSDDRSGSEYLVHNVFSSFRVFAETDQDEVRVALDQSQWEAFTLGKTALRVKGKNPTL